jgi:hypothetical protein
MSCKSCGSLNRSKFHCGDGHPFPGLKNIDEPVVWVISELTVCLDCGTAEFTVPKAEVLSLLKATPLRRVNLELSLTSH